MGLLPSDKPKNIREHLLRGLKYKQDMDSELSVTPLGLAENLLMVLRANETLDFASAIQADLVNIDGNLQLIDRWLSLEGDSQVLGRLAKQLEIWQKAEVAKRESLIKLGYSGNETRNDIEVRIAELKKSGAEEKNISLLASVKPADLPDYITVFLQKYNLQPSVTSEEMVGVEQHINNLRNNVLSSPVFVDLRQKFFGGKENISVGEWQKSIRDIKAMQLLLMVGSLTPQLIAFNRISSFGKKKATLSGSMDYLKKYFSNDQIMLDVLGEAEKIINEVSRPVGKDRMAIISTDNPMVALTIGKFPFGATSCQHYQNGDVVLAAYMADGYTKMNLLINLGKLPMEIQKALENAKTSEEKIQIFNNNTLAFLEASEGRRLTKIVRHVDDDKSELFLEPAYTPLDRSFVTRLFNAFAQTSLRPKIGIDLVRGAQKHTGHLVNVSESRNYRQYEDGENGGPGGGGGGLGEQRGAYAMYAQPIREADYMVG